MIWVLWTVVAVFILLIAYAAGFEAYHVRLKHITMRCRRLPKAFDGFTVLQLTDLHLDIYGRRERRMHRITRGLKPDIVAVTGDLAYDGKAAEVLSMVVTDAEAKTGAYAISGNSDLRYPEYYAEVQKVMKAAGIVFLENQHIILERDGQKIILVGVDDPHTGMDDLHQALEGAPKDTFIFLLAHSPALAIGAIEMGVDCMISGHTHGGQLSLPFIGPLFTRSGHGKGLAYGHRYGTELKEIVEIDPGNLQIYVSRGVGSSFLPIRFLSPPEVTLFTLRAMS